LWSRLNGEGKKRYDIGTRWSGFEPLAGAKLVSELDLGGKLRLGDDGLFSVD